MSASRTTSSPFAPLDPSPSISPEAACARQASVSSPASVDSARRSLPSGLFRPFQKVPHPQGFDPLNRFPVHSAAPAVPFDPQPGLFQYVPAVDSVIQRVETSALVLLRQRPKLALTLSCFRDRLSPTRVVGWRLFATMPSTTLFASMSSPVGPSLEQVMLSCPSSVIRPPYLPFERSLMPLHSFDGRRGRFF
jgi:hypothetical protein